VHLTIHKKFSWTTLMCVGYILTLVNCCLHKCRKSRKNNTKNNIHLMLWQHSYANRIYTEMKYSTRYISYYCKKSIQNAQKWARKKISTKGTAPPLTRRVKGSHTSMATTAAAYIWVKWLENLQIVLKPTSPHTGTETTPPSTSTQSAVASGGTSPHTGTETAPWSTSTHISYRTYSLSENRQHYTL